MTTSSASTTVDGYNLQLTEDQLDQLFALASAQSHRSRGAGDAGSMYATILSQYDRYGVNSMLPNHESVGYTFITRPKLNLCRASLRQDRIMSMLDSVDPLTLPFAIRCYLDTKWSQRQDVSPTAATCPFFNTESPFLIPLSNNLVSLSGWPDPVIDTETSEGGYYSEDLTMAKGSDRLNRTYDLTLTFRDIQGGFILALLYMWIRYMQLVVRGDITAYPEDIAARRINYTCSIYRFVMDPSRQFITKWSKATGCFPRSIPIGNVFNFGAQEKFISSSAEYSVPFTANTIEIMDPIIFRDFNTVSKRFSPNVLGVYNTASLNGTTSSAVGPVDLTPSSLTANQPFQFSVKPDTNFIGLPWVEVLGLKNKLNWICRTGDTIDPDLTSWDSIKAILASNLATSDSSSVTTPSTTQSTQGSTYV